MTKMTIGECSWCGDKPVQVLHAPRDTKVCAVCISLGDQIHKGAIPKDEWPAEMKRRVFQAAGHRLQRFMVRMTTLGQRAESTAWTWLDAKLEDNRQRLASDYWRKRKWWVVVDGEKVTATGFASQISAKEASGGKAVLLASFAEESKDGKIDPIASFFGMMGLMMTAGLVVSAGRTKRRMK